MTLTHIHTFVWIGAALAAAFMLELSGALRIGAAGVFAPLIIILLVGFFSVRWFAGFLAFLLLLLSFLVAPFWVLEVGGVALLTLFLLIAAPFLTGNRFIDFSILLAVGAALIAIGGAWTHGGVSLAVVLVTILLNLAVGATVFALLDRYASRARSFAL